MNGSMQTYLRLSALLSKNIWHSISLMMENLQGIVKKNIQAFQESLLTASFLAAFSLAFFRTLKENKAIIRYIKYSALV